MMFLADFELLYRCPYDFLECSNCICGLGYDACCVKLSIGSYGVCSRYRADVVVNRCSDGLPCNRFVEGFGFGGCLSAELHERVACCCHRCVVKVRLVVS